jgi:hypothetical protein
VHGSQCARPEQYSVQAGFRGDIRNSLAANEGISFASLGKLEQTIDHMTATVLLKPYLMAQVISLVKKKQKNKIGRNVSKVRCA